MNNKQPREQLEVRVIAMLLGEASDFETAELEAILAKDAELAGFKTRMQGTMGLLEDALKPEPLEVQPVVAQPKLSQERREALFKAFRQTPGQVVPLPEPVEVRTITTKTQEGQGIFTLQRLLVWGLAACIVAILGAMMLPALSKAKARSPRVAQLAAAKAAQLRAMMEVESDGVAASAPVGVRVTGFASVDHAPTAIALPTEAAPGYDSTAVIDLPADVADYAGPASSAPRASDGVYLPRAGMDVDGKNTARSGETSKDSWQLNRQNEVQSVRGGGADIPVATGTAAITDYGITSTVSTPAEDKRKQAADKLLAGGVSVGDDISGTTYSRRREGAKETDPEWLGTLEKPQSPHFGTNRFIGRYAYLGDLPAGWEDKLMVTNSIPGPGFAPNFEAEGKEEAAASPVRLAEREAVRRQDPPRRSLTRGSNSKATVEPEPAGPSVTVEAKLAEISQEDSKALGFDLGSLDNGVQESTVSGGIFPGPNDALGVSSSEVPQKSEVGTLLQDAKLFFERGELDKADNKLKEAIRRDPSHPAAKYYADLVKDQRFMRESSKQDSGAKAGAAKLVTNSGTIRPGIERKVVEQDAPAKKRSTPPATPQPEISTQENAFSTFSLNISDVSFKLAAASLHNNVIPEAASIRVEEFINAFNYRDPAPAPGARVAFAWERASYPFAHNRDVVRFSIQTATQGRDGQKPLNLVILLDNSGSMERPDRVAILREALKVLAQQLRPQDRISVISFSRTARLQVDGLAGGNAQALLDKVLDLNPEGGTNLEEAMNLGYATARRHFLSHGVNRVIVLTDGAANLGNVEPEELQKIVVAQRQKGIALDCFGIGWEGLNDDLLEVLSRNGDGRYGFLNQPEQAGPEFANQLAGALNVAASDVKTQVEFNPKRVTSWRQIGYAKHQLTKEQFRDNTVDAAEIAAAEQGNALYVIETNPRGSGPIGVARVRFKVPSTGEYIEQEWPLEYQPRVSTLDQASAAMRLSVTASAFGEWLSKSPFAAEVTLPVLQSLLAGVPETFSPDPRPQQLGTMIRQAQVISGK